MDLCNPLIYKHRWLPGFGIGIWRVYGGRSVLWDLILFPHSVSSELHFRTFSWCPRICLGMQTQAHTHKWWWEVSEVLSGRNKGKRRMWGFLYWVQMENVKITVTFLFWRNQAKFTGSYPPSLLSINLWRRLFCMTNNGDTSYLLSLGSLKTVQFTYETTYLLLDVVNSMSYISPYVSPPLHGPSTLPNWKINFGI